MKTTDGLEAAAGVAPMSARRIWFVYGLVALLIGAHLANALGEHEHWPFGPYLMFSQAATGSTSSLLRMRGVTDEPIPKEILLSKDPAYFAPMPVYHLRLCFDRALWLWGDGQPQQLETLCRDYLARYEQRRVAGLHHGPRLLGLRLYRYEWTMEPTASNAATPDRISLLYDTLQLTHGEDSHVAR